MEIVGPEKSEQNQGDHSQETAKCGGALGNAQDSSGGRVGTAGARGKGHVTQPEAVERASRRW